MNRTRTGITVNLISVARSHGCRVQMTDDGYIEVFPQDERDWFDGEAATSLICDSVRDAIQRIKTCSISRMPEDDPLPRCKHGYCLLDASCECLQPPCGCRYHHDDAECMHVKKWGL